MIHQLRNNTTQGIKAFSHVHSHGIKVVIQRTMQMEHDIMDKDKLKILKLKGPCHF